MRRPLIEWMILAARIVVGGALVAASIEKIADPAAFAASIGNYRLVGSAVAMAAATILPWIELLCGMGLLFGLLVRTNSLMSLILFIVFTAAVASAVARGLDISCGCFTQDPEAGKIGWTKFLENGGLILLSIFLYIVPGTRWSLGSYLQHRTGH